MAKIEIWQRDPLEFGLVSTTCISGKRPRAQRAAMRKTWEGECEAVASATSQDESDLAICEMVFVKFNADDRPTAHTSYSLSVGDAVAVDGRPYMVGMVGFQPVALEEWAADA